MDSRLRGNDGPNIVVPAKAGTQWRSSNDQWRICFRWKDNDAWDVEIVDYH
jgi:hypothetical protein